MRYHCQFMLRVPREPLLTFAVRKGLRNFTVANLRKLHLFLLPDKSAKRLLKQQLMADISLHVSGGGFNAGVLTDILLKRAAEGDEETDTTSPVHEVDLEEYAMDEVHDDDFQEPADLRYPGQLERAEQHLGVDLAFMAKNHPKRT